MQALIPLLLHPGVLDVEVRKFDIVEEQVTPVAMET
jgi:hypothetical protein